MHWPAADWAYAVDVTHGVKQVTNRDTRLVTSKCADGRSLLTAVRLGDWSGAFIASVGIGLAA